MYRNRHGHLFGRFGPGRGVDLAPGERSGAVSYTHLGRTSRLLEEGDLLAQVEVDLLHGRVYALLGRDKQAHWVKGCLLYTSRCV